MPEKSEKELTAELKLDNTCAEDLAENCKKYLAAQGWENVRESEPAVTVAEMMSVLVDVQNYYMDSVTDDERAALDNLLTGGMSANLYRCVTAADYETVAEQYGYKLTDTAIDGNNVTLKIADKGDNKSAEKLARILDNYRLINTKITVIYGT
ncbi:hypothetical protein FACS1894120_1020 [Clostridia bacterium]|nr:hypothetical protein FACS1894120_1020 [Clostridia bacterium]